MESMIRGMEIFQHKVYPSYRVLFEELAGGQNPEVLLITCSDSRIDPSLVTQTQPGELFLIRNAGNIVPAHGAGGGETATIEYALKVLGIRNVIVCGHTDCGAMKALLNPETLTGLPDVKDWLQPAQPALRALEGELPEGKSKSRAVIEENVLVQIENLKTHPAVAQAMEEKNLVIVGLVYEIETGEFWVHRPKQGAWIRFSEMDPGELLPDATA